MCEMRSQIGLNPGQEPASGEPVERRQQHATFARGQMRRKFGARRDESPKNLSKDQFGVLAKGTLRKLYSRIEAPWPELIEGVGLLYTRC
jgi:hypothetical protein